MQDQEPKANEGPFYGLSDEPPAVPVVDLQDAHLPETTELSLPNGPMLKLNQPMQVLESVNALKTGKALFIDIDDTVRKGFSTTGKWVNKPEDVDVFTGVPELLWRYRNAGYRVLGISNQGGIATRQVTRQNVYNTMVETMKQCRWQGRDTFDHIVICPHHPNAKDKTESECFCRKPRPGMIFQAQQWVSLTYNEWLLPSQSLFVGDRPEDAKCARAVGVTFIDAAKWRDGAGDRYLDRGKPPGPQLQVFTGVSGTLTVK